MNWLKRNALLGDKHAQFFLGAFYYYGIAVEQNDTKVVDR